VFWFQTSWLSDPTAFPNYLPNIPIIAFFRKMVTAHILLKLDGVRLSTLRTGAAQIMQILVLLRIDQAFVLLAVSW